MAITVTQRAAINSSADDASIELEVVLTLDRIYLALIYTSGDPVPKVSSITGTGIEMEEIPVNGSPKNGIASGLAYIDAWIGKCTASGTVTITVALDGTSENSDVVIYELDGVDNTTAAGVIAQAECFTSEGTPDTSTGLDLADFAKPTNRPLAFAVHQADESTDHDSGDGYTELLDASHGSPDTGFCVQWHSSSPDDRPGFTWSTSSEHGAIALELVALAETPMAALVREPRRREKRVQQRRRRELFAEWFPFPATPALAVVSSGSLSQEVRLEAGDEVRVTLSGPSCTNPQARIGLGFRRVQ